MTKDVFSLIELVALSMYFGVDEPAVKPFDCVMMAEKGY
jgi:hypothetical protein